MGKAYNYRCTKCFYEDQFFEGQGFMDHKFILDEYVKNMQGSIHYKTYEKLLSLNKKYAHAIIEIKEEIYKCKNCNCVLSKSIVKVESFEGIVYEKRIKCNHCNSAQVKHYKISKNRIEKCPKCEQKSLKFDTYMCWD